MGKWAGQAAVCGQRSWRKQKHGQMAQAKSTGKWTRLRVGGERHGEEAGAAARPNGAALGVYIVQEACRQRG